jgi:acyl carrier protein
MGLIMKKKIIQIILATIKDINEELDEKILIKNEADTPLYGNGSELDSLGLVTLIVALEQNIEDEFELSITLADERAMSQKRSPFRTIGSLADYIEKLLEEKLND